jgi:phenylacetate-coenzyme A ligase PaaK-like adenylate-forming protein
MSATASLLRQQIFNIQTPAQFEAITLDVFRYQAANNLVYKQFLNYMGCNTSKVTRIADIPFLPLELFKTQHLVTGNLPIEQTFTSSGTTGAQTSQHHVCDLMIYEESFTRSFEHFYGTIDQYCVLALLPAYLERTGSSLVYMANKFIEQSHHPKSGFYLYNYANLAKILQELNNIQQKTLLLGVSFGLWDLAEQYPQPLHHTLIMETGGMKGKRPEIVRPHLHQILQNAFGVTAIHSEYGMTELLSQAYSQGQGIFNCPAWMQVLVREPNDPLHILTTNQVGCLNVIDLANLHSCSFLATADLGKVFDDNSFEILGRMDSSDVRGCNLMVL